MGLFDDVTGKNGEGMHSPDPINREVANVTRPWRKTPHPHDTVEETAAVAAGAGIDIAQTLGLAAALPGPSPETVSAMITTIAQQTAASVTAVITEKVKKDLAELAGDVKRGVEAYRQESATMNRRISHMDGEYRSSWATGVSAYLETQAKAQLNLMDPANLHKYDAVLRDVVELRARVLELEHKVEQQEYLITTAVEVLQRMQERLDGMESKEGA